MTNKIQKLESVMDLELLKEGDTIETEAYGKIVYLANNKEIIICAKREMKEAILKLRIPREKSIIGEDGKLYFKGADCIHITLDHPEYQNISRLVEGVN